ncbi:Protein dopey-1-like protein, partial [Diplonema papillatum]
MDLNEEQYLRVPRFKNFRDDLRKSLASFENRRDWADITKALAGLQKVLTKYKDVRPIPSKLLLAKRLGQTLNPSLPSGVHRKVLEAYQIIFTNIGSHLSTDFPIYAPGLFKLFPDSSTDIKPLILNIYEANFVSLPPTALEPCLGGLLCSVMPALEEENTEIYPTVLKLVQSLQKKFVKCGMQDCFMLNLWEVLKYHEPSRVACLQHLSTVLPRSSKNKKESSIDLELLGNNPSLVVSAICAALKSGKEMVLRGALDLITNCFMIHETGVLAEDDKQAIMHDVLILMAREELPLTRRISKWFSGDDEPNPEYFAAHASPRISISFSKHINDARNDQSFERASAVIKLADLLGQEVQENVMPAYVSFLVKLDPAQQPEATKAVRPHVLLEYIVSQMSGKGTWWSEGETDFTSSAKESAENTAVQTVARDFFASLPRGTARPPTTEWMHELQELITVLASAVELKKRSHHDRLYRVLWSFLFASKSTLASPLCQGPSSHDDQLQIILGSTRSISLISSVFCDALYTSPTTYSGHAPFETFLNAYSSFLESFIESVYPVVAYNDTGDLVPEDCIRRKSLPSSVIRSGYKGSALGELAVGATVNMLNYMRDGLKLVSIHRDRATGSTEEDMQVSSLAASSSFAASKLPPPPVSTEVALVIVNGNAEDGVNFDKGETMGADESNTDSSDVGVVPKWLLHAWKLCSYSEGDTKERSSVATHCRQLLVDYMCSEFSSLLGDKIVRALRRHNLMKKLLRLLWYVVDRDPLTVSEACQQLVQIANAEGKRWRALLNDVILEDLHNEPHDPESAFTKVKPVSYSGFERFCIFWKVCEDLELLDATLVSYGVRSVLDTLRSNESDQALIGSSFLQVYSQNIGRIFTPYLLLLYPVDLGAGRGSVRKDSKKAGNGVNPESLNDREEEDDSESEKLDESICERLNDTLQTEQSGVVKGKEDVKERYGGDSDDESSALTASQTKTSFMREEVESLHEEGPSTAPSAVHEEGPSCDPPNVEETTPASVPEDAPDTLTQMTEREIVQRQENGKEKYGGVSDGNRPHFQEGTMVTKGNTATTTTTPATVPSTPSPNGIADDDSERPLAAFVGEKVDSLHEGSPGVPSEDLSRDSPVRNETTSPSPVSVPEGSEKVSGNSASPGLLDDSPRFDTTATTGNTTATVRSAPVSPSNGLNSPAMLSEASPRSTSHQPLDEDTTKKVQYVLSSFRSLFQVGDTSFITRTLTQMADGALVKSHVAASRHKFVDSYFSVVAGCGAHYVNVFMATEDERRAVLAADLLSQTLLRGCEVAVTKRFKSVAKGLIDAMIRSVEVGLRRKSARGNAVALKVAGAAYVVVDSLLPSSFPKLDPPSSITEQVPSPKDDVYLSQGLAPSNPAHRLSLLGEDLRRTFTPSLLQSAEKPRSGSFAEAPVLLPPFIFSNPPPYNLTIINVLFSTMSSAVTGSLISCKQWCSVFLRYLPLLTQSLHPIASLGRFAFVRILTTLSEAPLTSQNGQTIEEVLTAYGTLGAFLLRLAVGSSKNSVTTGKEAGKAAQESSNPAEVAVHEFCRSTVSVFRVIASTLVRYRKERDLWPVTAHRLGKAGGYEQVLKVAGAAFTVLFRIDPLSFATEVLHLWSEEILNSSWQPIVEQPNDLQRAYCELLLATGHHVEYEILLGTLMDVTSDSVARARVKPTKRDKAKKPNDKPDQSTAYFELFGGDLVRVFFEAVPAAKIVGLAKVAGSMLAWCKELAVVTSHVLAHPVHLRVLSSVMKQVSDCAFVPGSPGSTAKNQATCKAFLTDKKVSREIHEVFAQVMHNVPKVMLLDMNNAASTPTVVSAGTGVSVDLTAVALDLIAKDLVKYKQAAPLVSADTIGPLLVSLHTQAFAGILRFNEDQPDKIHALRKLHIRKIHSILAFLIAADKTFPKNAARHLRQPLLEHVADASFFVVDPATLSRWKRLIASLIGGSDVTVIEMIEATLSRIQVPTGLGSVFVSSEREVNDRASGLRRLAFQMICSGQHLSNAHLLASIFEKLIESLKNYADSSMVLRPIMICFRTIICKADTHSLASFWPLVVPWLIQILTLKDSDRALIIEALKFIDFVRVIMPS